MVPVRMGYVIRCSKTRAVFKNDKVYIEENDNYIELEKMTQDNADQLKGLYYKENITDEIINYDDFYFSMNNGDYTKPTI